MGERGSKKGLPKDLALAKEMNKYCGTWVGLLLIHSHNVFVHACVVLLPGRRDQKMVFYTGIPYLNLCFLFFDVVECWFSEVE